MNSNDLGATSSTSLSLLDRVRARDPDAWQRLTDLYGPLVYHWCRRCGLGTQDSADVFQETFAAVAANIDSFRRDARGGTFRGWLWTIARNKVRDHCRQQSRQAEATGGTEAQQRLAQVPDKLADDPDDQADHGELGRLFHRGLDLIRAEFEDRTWQAFWRVSVNGDRAADIAADLGISANAVRQYKSRVLRRLREELRDLME